LRSQEDDVTHSAHTPVDAADPDSPLHVQREPATVWIVGKNTFQNNLLKSFLAQAPDASLDVISGEGWTSEKDTRFKGNTLVLMDCFAGDPRDVWMKLSLGGGPDPLSRAVALFNVAPSAGSAFERQAIEKRVRGVFYLNDSPAHLLRGILKILQGEVWYSRKATSEALLENRHLQRDTELAEAMLTVREKEILIAIAAGAGNSDIAEELCISLHTVKAHLYNVYRKIEVRNRLEATLWVARYL
jgi:LuxR family transcriptional regulator, positive regulator of biofilm formation